MTPRTALTTAGIAVALCFGVIIAASPKHPGVAAAAAVVGLAGIMVFLCTWRRAFPAAGTRRP